MGTGQAIVVGAAAAVVLVAYARWIRERLDHPRGRLAPDQTMFLLVAPIALAAVPVGVAFWSWQTACWFALLALSLQGLATRVVWAGREIRRRRPVKAEDRRRRIEERAERRRARGRAMERYGPSSG